MSGVETETEETIDQYLADLQMLEDGMSLEDKRSLWEVIKISKNTAQAEEEDRQKRAQSNLQFDEVSSRTEIPKDIEKEGEKIPIVACVSPRLRSSSQDGPKTATVLPFCHSPTSSSVSSSSRTFTTPGSPSQQSSSVDARESSRQGVVEPSARRGLRSRNVNAQPHVNDSRALSADPEGSPFIQISQSSRSVLKPSPAMNVQNSPSSEIRQRSLSPQTVQNVPSPRSINNVPSPRSINNAPSPRSINDVPSPRNINNVPSPISRDVPSPQCIKDVPTPQSVQNVASPRTVTDVSSAQRALELNSELENDLQQDSLTNEVTTDNTETNLPSSSSVSAMEVPDEEPASGDHESSPVRRVRQGFNLCLKFQQPDENSEDCALNEKERSDDVPSPASKLNEKLNSNGEKIELDLRERNIDAFNCDRSNYGLTLKATRHEKMNSRLPFYFPPHKMDVHSYINYFKKCVNDHAARLLEHQKKSHKCVPWGDPVVVGEVSSNTVVRVEQNNTPSLQRYNFRQRRVEHQKVETIHEDSEGQGDIKTQDDNDDLFNALLQDDKSSESIEILKKEEVQECPKSTKVPDRQGSKRKSESSDEMEEKHAATGSWLCSVKTEEEEKTAVKRKKLGTASSWKDLDINIVEDDGDDEEYFPNKGPQKRGPGKRRKNQRTLFNHKQSKPVYVEDESNLFAEAADVKVINTPKPRQEADIIKPGPIKLKRQGRHRVQQSAQNEPEVAVIYDAAETSNKEEDVQDMEVPCPICRVAYPSKDIEAHASECNEYCAEEILDDDERSPSPLVPSEDIWTQYDNIHETNTQGTAASKHSYGAM